MFQSLFEKGVLSIGSLKCFLGLDNQVEINLYLIKATALHHFGEFGGMTPSWCPISLLESRNLNLISFQWFLYIQCDWHHKFQDNMLFFAHELEGLRTRYCMRGVLLQPVTRQLCATYWVTGAIRQLHEDLLLQVVMWQHVYGMRCSTNHLTKVVWYGLYLMCSCPTKTQHINNIVEGHRYKIIVLSPFREGHSRLPWTSPLAPFYPKRNLKIALLPIKKPRHGAT